jgi:hypothetical protein
MAADWWIAGNGGVSSSREVHTAMRLRRSNPEVRKSGLAAWGGCKDTAADRKRVTRKVGWEE